MTVSKDQKKKIRELAKKMGCSYSTARMVFLSRKDGRQNAEIEHPQYVKPHVILQYDLRVRTIEMPVVTGKPTDIGLNIVCPFCGDTHWHSRGEGTRIAHCKSKGTREYYIRPIGATGPFLGWGEPATDETRDLLPWMDVQKTTQREKVQWVKPHVILRYDFQGRTVEMPVATGKPMDSGLAIVCPFCGDTHMHSRGEGTRHSHCEGNKGGREYYYIRPIGATGPFLGWGEPATNEAPGSH